MGMEFKFTIPGILQQNDRVKWKFATLLNQVCATLNGRKFTAFLRNGSWAEAANAAMLLENNHVTPNRNISPFQQILGSILSSAQKFGKMYITTYGDNIYQSKLANSRAPGIWAGFMEGHKIGTYPYLTPRQKNIPIKDVIFLQKSWKDYIKVKKPVLVTMSYEGLNDEEELETVPIINQDNYCYNLVSNSESDNEDEENLFDEDVKGEVKTTPKTQKQYIK